LQKKRIITGFCQQTPGKKRQQRKEIFFQKQLRLLKKRKEKFEKNDFFQTFLFLILKAVFLVGVFF
jgi:hypothetical protein